MFVCGEVKGEALEQLRLEQPPSSPKFRKNLLQCGVGGETLPQLEESQHLWVSFDCEVMMQH